MSGWRITNYWVLIGWCVAVAVIFPLFIPQTAVRVNGQRKYRYPVIAVIVACIPLMLWAANRSWVGDTEVYRRTFTDMPVGMSGLSSYVDAQTKDKGFYFLSYLFKTLVSSSDVLYFGAIAALQILCVMLVYRRYSSDFVLSAFLFVVSTDYLSWCFNGIRQFVAVCILFACTGLMLKRRYLPLLIGIILAVSTIHQTALLMIPLVLICQGKAWNFRTIIFIAAAVAAVAFIGRFTTLLNDMLTDTQYSDIMQDEIWMNDDGTSPIRVLVYSLPAIISFFGRRIIRESNNPLINFCTNMSVASAGIYLVSAVTSGIFVGRLPIYASLYSYMIYPWMLRHMFTEESGSIVRVLLIIGYLLLFYFQMHIAWGVI